VEVVVNTCETFHNDRLRSDRSLENQKFVNNKNNVCSAWRPVSRS